MRLLSILALASLLIAPSAFARGPGSGSFELSSSEVLSQTRDKKGRLAESSAQLYDKAGDYTGARVSTYTYGRHGMLSVITRYLDADDAEKTRIASRNVYSKKGVQTERIVRVTQPDGELTRQEISTWERVRATGMTTITTEVTNGAGELIETRYQIDTFEGRRRVSTDLSIFAPDGAQKLRQYTEYRDDRRELWTFDAEDEIKTRELVRMTRDSKGQIQLIEADLFLGRSTNNGSRIVRYARDASGRTLQSVTTWFDAEEQGLRRRTSNHAANGQTRVLWETWE